MADTQDPNLWLEDIDGEKSLQWVRAQNAVAEKALTTSPDFKQAEADILAVLDSQEKIPYVGKRGDYYYNYWQDDKNPRGLWRRTTLDEYKKPNPQWDNILDLDALNQAENATWVWHGADCLRPDYRHCLISLSAGGSDADETREYDLEKRAFVKDGFYRPAAKGSMSWIDKDHVYIQTDFGAGSLTHSGYPSEARLWTRGTPLRTRPHPRLRTRLRQPHHRRLHQRTLPAPGRRQTGENRRARYRRKRRGARLAGHHPA